MNSTIIKKKIEEKQLLLRDQLWPDLKEDDLWNRKKKKGFTTIPRTLPYFMRIMDNFSNGKPVSSTYLDLWCRMYDTSFLNLSGKQQEMAFSSGFSGQRALQTWSQRIDILKGLGFIDVKSGPSGPRSFVLVRNPYIIVKRLYSKNPDQFREEAWNALLNRSMEIGATDLNNILE